MIVFIKYICKILKSFYIVKGKNFQKQLISYNIMLYLMYQTLKLIPILKMYILSNGFKKLNLSFKISFMKIYLKRKNHDL